MPLSPSARHLIISLLDREEACPDLASGLRRNLASYRNLDLGRFIKAMSHVASEKYGHTDALARLVYFKLLRFGRRATGTRAPFRRDKQDAGGDEPRAEMQNVIGNDKRRDVDDMRPGCQDATPSIPSLSPDPKSIRYSSSASPGNSSTPPRRHKEVSCDDETSPLSSRYATGSPARGGGARGRLMGDEDTGSDGNDEGGAFMRASPPRGSPAAHLVQSLSPPPTSRSGVGTATVNSPRVRRATLLSQHKHETRRIPSMYLSAHLLMSIFGRYSKRGRMGMNMNDMGKLLGDLDLVPGLVSRVAFEKIFLSAQVRGGLDNGGQDLSSGSTTKGFLDYGGMLRCLKACADQAFSKDESGTEDQLIQRIRDKLFVPNLRHNEDGQGGESNGYTSSSASESSRSSSRSDSPVCQGAIPRPGHGHDAVKHRNSGEKSSVEQVSLQHRAAMEELITLYTKREIAQRADMDAAALALEKSAAERIQSTREKYMTEAARFRPGSAILSLRGRLKERADVLTDDERNWMEREVRIKEEEERKTYEAGVQRKMKIAEKKIQGDLHKAKTALKEDAIYRQQKLASEMEASFQKLKLKFEARTRHANERQKATARHANLAAFSALQHKVPIESKSPKKATASQERARPSSNTADAGCQKSHERQQLLQIESKGIQKRMSVSASKAAMSDLKTHLRLMFGNVFEVFVFLDAHNDHTVHINELSRQLPLLYPDVKLDQVMSEIKGKDSEGRKNVMEVIDFAKCFGWHPLGTLDEQQACYLQVLKHRRRIVERVGSTILQDKDVGQRRKGKSVVSRRGRSHMSDFPSTGHDTAGQTNLPPKRSRPVSATQHRPVNSVESTFHEKVSTLTRKRATSATISNRVPVSDPVLTELEVQNQRLADQVYDAEFQLAAKRNGAVEISKTKRADKPVGACSKRPSTRQRKMPEFVGPKGGYKDSDGLMSHLRGDDTRTISKYVSRTGLWIAVPSTSRPQPQRRPAYQRGDVRGVDGFNVGCSDVHYSCDILGDQEHPSDHSAREGDVITQQQQEEVEEEEKREKQEDGLQRMPSSGLTPVPVLPLHPLPDQVRSINPSVATYALNNDEDTSDLSGISSMPGSIDQFEFSPSPPAQRSGALADRLSCSGSRAGPGAPAAKCDDLDSSPQAPLARIKGPLDTSAHWDISLSNDNSGDWENACEYEHTHIL